MSSSVSALSMHLNLHADRPALLWMFWSACPHANLPALLEQLPIAAVATCCHLPLLWIVLREAAAAPGLASPWSTLARLALQQRMVSISTLLPASHRQLWCLCPRPAAMYGSLLLGSHKPLWCLCPHPAAMCGSGVRAQASPLPVSAPQEAAAHGAPLMQVSSRAVPMAWRCLTVALVMSQ